MEDGVAAAAAAATAADDGGMDAPDAACDVTGARGTPCWSLASHNASAAAVAAPRAADEKGCACDGACDGVCWLTDDDDDDDVKARWSLGERCADTPKGRAAVAACGDASVSCRTPVGLVLHTTGRWLVDVAAPNAGSADAYAAAWAP